MKQPPDSLSLKTLAPSPLSQMQKNLYEPRN
jgi:hypothetical protein